MLYHPTVAGFAVSGTACSNARVWTTHVVSTSDHPLSFFSALTLSHLQGVRDVKFNHDGTQFMSTGYDKNVRLWDTETGQVLRTFNTGMFDVDWSLYPQT